MKSHFSTKSSQSRFIWINLKFKNMHNEYSYSTCKYKNEVWRSIISHPFFVASRNFRERSHKQGVMGQKNLAKSHHPLLNDKMRFYAQEWKSLGRNIFRKLKSCINNAYWPPYIRLKMKHSSTEVINFEMSCGYLIRGRF